MLTSCAARLATTLLAWYLRRTEAREKRQDGGPASFFFLETLLAVVDFSPAFALYRTYSRWCLLLYIMSFVTHLLADYNR